ncbi:MAG: hypothetical protein DSM106950_43380 [Stigonema ocellatum SAG 48.90 = DSM 106950]|nr:hypothetical protein [Stigonema ocellatum SAG 48.90 = DSM 106950]
MARGNANPKLNHRGSLFADCMIREWGVGSGEWGVGEWGSGGWGMVVSC